MFNSIEKYLQKRLDQTRANKIRDKWKNSTIEESIQKLEDSLTKRFCF